MASILDPTVQRPGAAAALAPVRSGSQRRGLAAIALGLLLIALLLAARTLPYGLGIVPAVLFEHLTLPGMLGALAAGAGLGASGAILQGLTRNPLASPGLLGVTAGAHLAIVLALAVFGAQVPLILAAFLGAVAAMVLTWLLVGPAGRHGAALALAGVAVTLCFSAVAAAITLIEEQRMAGAFLWSAGAPLMAGWAAFGQLAPWIALGLAVAAFMVRGLDLLALGPAMARSLALSPGRLTAAGFVASGLAAGAAVALTGPVAFVGLIAPNALRRLGVRRHAWLLPAAAVWGGALLLGAHWLADAVSRVGREVPMGVITAIVGAPVFLALIARLRHGGGASSAGGGGRRHGALALAAAGCLAVAFASLSLGDTVLAPAALVAALTGQAGDMAFVVLELRLPRLLVAATAGALFALAGGLLQAALRNPLAAPETLGIVQGAALASLFALMAGAAPGGAAMQAAALAGGLGAVAVVFAVARRAGLAPVPLVLGGVALAALFASLSALTLLIAQLQAAQALVWLTGSAYARGWPEWLALLPLGGVAVAAAVALAPRLDTSSLGDHKARTLGLPVARVRLAASAAAALATAAAVSVVGSVAFVGLLGPHLARLLHGGTLARRLPLIVLCGAGVTALADLAGRVLLAPVQLPMGVMASVVGAPYFLWLMRRTRGGAG